MFKDRDGSIETRLLATIERLRNGDWGSAKEMKKHMLTMAECMLVMEKQAKGKGEDMWNEGSETQESTTQESMTQELGDYPPAIRQTADGYTFDREAYRRRMQDQEWVLAQPYLRTEEDIARDLKHIKDGQKDRSYNEMAFELSKYIVDIEGEELIKWFNKAIEGDCFFGELWTPGRCEIEDQDLYIKYAPWLPFQMLLVIAEGGEDGETEYHKISPKTVLRGLRRLFHADDPATDLGTNWDFVKKVVLNCTFHGACMDTEGAKKYEEEDLDGYDCLNLIQLGLFREIKYG